MSALSNKDMIKSLKHEALKEFREYDGLSRPIAVYQANTDADNGDMCLKTEYTYVLTSNRIEKKKETLTAWLSIWDIV